MQNNISHCVTRTLEAFPFYQIEPASWQRIEGKKLRLCWPETETHLVHSIAGDAVELLQMIALDKDMHLTHSRIIAVGTVDHLYAKLRYVAEQALALDAHGIILAHNHTSGDAQPSWDDISYTRTLQHGIHNLGILLVDHMIVGHEIVFSLRRNGLIF